MGELATPKPSYRKIVAALAESEERYRVLVEGVQRYAIFMLDPAGIIRTWNRGIRELFGYDRDEVVGKSGAIVLTAADRAKGVFKEELALAKRDGESTMEHSNVHKDGTQLQVHDTTASLLNSQGYLIGFAKVTRRTDLPDDHKTEDAALELARALAALALEVEHRERLEAELLTAVETERERLGRDLHDDLCQRLAAIAMITRALRKQIKGNSERNREKAGTIVELLEEALGVARNLSRGLHPVTLTTQGLPGALVELAARVPKPVRFTWPQSKRLELEESVALHVYRIAEEAVGNAIRHSGAGKIKIRLEPLSRGKVTLTIADNGRGFDQGHARDGMGLRNMKYRARAIGGSLSVAPGVPSGTLVKCSFPLRRAQRSS